MFFVYKITDTSTNKFYINIGEFQKDTAPLDTLSYFELPKNIQNQLTINKLNFECLLTGNNKHFVKNLMREIREKSDTTLLINPIRDTSKKVTVIEARELETTSYINEDGITVKVYPSETSGLIKRRKKV